MNKNTRGLKNFSTQAFLCTTIIQCHTRYRTLMTGVCTDDLTSSQVPQTSRMVTRGGDEVGGIGTEDSIPYPFGVLRQRAGQIPRCRVP